jgi:RNA polymerase sigma-70 factor (ECF subfamily)
LTATRTSQQAYVNAYAHLRQFDRRAKFSTWLTKIAIQEALGRASKRGRHDAVDFTEGGEPGRGAAGIT